MGLEVVTESKPFTRDDVHRLLDALLVHGHGELRVVVHGYMILSLTPMPLIRTPQELSRWHVDGAKP